MKNKSELSRFIRFRLDNLRVENGHHTFEDIARQYARLRISDRIIPATGPVSAGGDQGLDFETFRTYLASSPLTEQSFLGSDTFNQIAFAASLQRNIRQKIRDDVETISKAPIPFDEICYFCEQNVPVGARHALQAWAKQQFGIRLQIFDGFFLSEELAEPNLFWIADQFLGVPAELYPRFDTIDNRYGQLSALWLGGDRMISNYADFAEVKEGIRSATFVEARRPDIGRWIRVFKEFLADTLPDSLKRKALYEVLVSALRGQNNMTAYVTELRRYFDQIDQLQEIMEIEDAVNLMVYSNTAYHLNHLVIPKIELLTSTQAVVDKISNELATADGSERKARLLQERGQIQLALAVLNESVDQLQGALTWWMEMIGEVKRAPLFPLERFADILTEITLWGKEYPDFVVLTSTTDELLSQRSSGYVAAEKCRDRAMRLFDAEDYVGTIQLMQRAKIRWFTAETLRGAILSMFVIAQCYQKLGMIYASKYYCAGAALIAIERGGSKHYDLGIELLTQFANNCYMAGDWFSFGSAAQTVFAAERAFRSTPAQEQADDIDSVVGHLHFVRVLSSILCPDQIGSVDEVLKVAVGSASDWEVIFESSEDSAAEWGRRADSGELWMDIQDQLWGRPFSDTGAERVIAWKALGIEWELRSSIGFKAASIAEEIAAVCQIVLADIANKELLLLPLKVTVDIELTGEHSWSTLRIPSNEKAAWKVQVPLWWIGSWDHVHDLRMNVMNAVIEIITEASVLPEEALEDTIDDIFGNGLPEKAFLAAPYSELIARYTPESEYNYDLRRNMHPARPDWPFGYREGAQMKWMAEDGPGYSKSRAQEFLANRYRKSVLPISRWLLVHKEDPAFQMLLEQLRNEGLLDWQILVIVASIVVHERAELQVRDSQDVHEWMRLTNTLMFSEEEPNAADIPVSALSLERCLLQHKMNQVSVAQTWGLCVRQRTPAHGPLEHLLNVRYHQDSDDIPHEAIGAHAIGSKET